MKVLLLAILILSVLLLTGCPDNNDPGIDAKYLVLNNCKYTGEAFDSVDRQWFPTGRGAGYFKDIPHTYYIYICNNNKKQISLLKLKVEKVE